MFVKKVAKARFLRTGDRKLRQLARTIQGLRAEQALERLNFATKRKLALTLAKTLKSAVANAMETDLGGRKVHPEDLLVSMVAVDTGPIQKRMEFRAMGRANRIQKRYCHLTIEVSGYAAENEPGGRAKKKTTAKRKAVSSRKKAASKTATRKSTTTKAPEKARSAVKTDSKTAAKETATEAVTKKVTKKAAVKKATTRKTVAKKADTRQGRDSGSESV